MNCAAAFTRKLVCVHPPRAAARQEGECARVHAPSRSSAHTYRGIVGARCMPVMPGGARWPIACIACMRQHARAWRTRAARVAAALTADASLPMWADSTCASRDGIRECIFKKESPLLLVSRGPSRRVRPLTADALQRPASTRPHPLQRWEDQQALLAASPCACALAAGRGCRCAR